jgi:hypothetical protein
MCGIYLIGAFYWYRNVVSFLRDEHKLEMTVLAEGTLLFTTSCNKSLESPDCEKHCFGQNMSDKTSN